MNQPALAPAPAVVPKEHRFLFDLHGFVLLRGVLAADEVADLLAAVRRLEAATYDDAPWLSRLSPEQRKRAIPTRWNMVGPTSVRMNGLLRLDPAFDVLIDHPTVLPYLRDFVGAPQLINTWSIAKGCGADRVGWHRGVAPSEYFCREGAIFSPMVNVVWFLTDNGPEDGCMCAVPGSHKSGLARPGGYLDLRVLPGGADFEFGAYEGLALPGSVAVTGKPGDVLVMSEAVIHGGLPKATPGVRTNLYFNYLSRLRSVDGCEPHNLRHFWLSEAMRARLTPQRRQLTEWMEHARIPGEE